MKLTKINIYCAYMLNSDYNLIRYLTVNDVE